MQFHLLIQILSATLVGNAVAVQELRATPYDPCTPPSPANSSVDLQNWAECAANRFFPYSTNPYGPWQQAFDEIFDPSLRASFNTTMYDFDGWKQQYASFARTLDAVFGGKFQHGFLTTVAVPNSNDKGGVAYLTGWEGGPSVKGELWYTDATMMVVNQIGGQRKIVEMRESSNIPNSAAIVGVKPWHCGF